MKARHPPWTRPPGSIGVGFGLMYTEAATYAEILDMFRTAGSRKGMSYRPHGHAGPLEPGGLVGHQRGDRRAEVGGGPVHVVHLNSMSLNAGVFAQMMRTIEDARRHVSNHNRVLSTIPRRKPAQSDL